RKGLEGALHNALSSYVDPASRGHLTVHRETERFQTAELIPVRPVPHQIRISDKNSRSMLVSAEDPYRLSRLHTQRLIISQGFQGTDNIPIALPVARGLTSPSVNNQLCRFFRHFAIQVVHQHSLGGFLRPAFAGQLHASWGDDGLIVHKATPQNMPGKHSRPSRFLIRDPRQSSLLQDLRKLALRDQVADSLDVESKRSVLLQAWGHRADQFIDLLCATPRLQRS